MTRISDRNPAARGVAAVLLAMSLCAGGIGAAQASEQSGSEAASGDSKADSVVVVPYETRPTPSYRVDLRDDRIYFLKKLEQDGDTYVLHTLENEVIEVDASEIAKIVEFKRQ